MSGRAEEQKVPAYRPADRNVTQQVIIRNTRIGIKKITASILRRFVFYGMKPAASLIFIFIEKEIFL